MTQVRFNRRPFDVSFNNLMSDLFTDFPVNNKNTQDNGNVAVNIVENDSSYKLNVVAPGFEKTDFKVNLDQDLLTISAEYKSQDGSTDQKNVRKEYSFRSFKRTFTLDEKIDASTIEASYVNGVLTLNLPKKVEVKSPAKEINIQ